MREIKFRGKEGKTGKWLYGVFFKHERYTRYPFITSGEEMPPPEYVYLIINSGFSDWNLPRPIDAYSIDPVTVGQYTGLKDKNGKEIFEGDIVNISQEEDYGLIAWDDDSARYVILFSVNNLADFDHYWGYELEIIGNIYDNPELLEVAHEGD